MTKKNKLCIILSVFVCSIIFVCMLPSAVFADENTPVAWIGETGYESLEAAVNAAKSDDTIILGEGKYTLYKKGANTKGKNLTFVGQGADKTAWGIGATVPDPAYFGTEYNSDYSFDGAGTITFKNMTLQSAKADYLGFARADNTVVENCIINGKTFYWGYKSATFNNTTFNSPVGDYALWTYSSPVMTFNGCTFNSTGKTINVYTDYGAGNCDITVNFNNCTVNFSAGLFGNKSVLNINDYNMGDFKYRINISGNNTIEGADPYRDPVTCSRWFGFGGKASTNNTGRSIVTIDGKTAFENGKMVTHELNSNYTDGYKDNAYDVTRGDWKKTGDGKYTRTVNKVCKYCGYQKDSNEEGYSVTYTDGVDDEEIFADQTTIVAAGEVTPKFDETTISRQGYNFKGWNPNVEETVTGNVVYTAVWEKQETEKPETPVQPEPSTTPTQPETSVTPVQPESNNNLPNTNESTISDEVSSNITSPKTGDASNAFLWVAIIAVSGSVVVGTRALNKKHNR